MKIFTATIFCIAAHANPTILEQIEHRIPSGFHFDLYSQKTSKPTYELTNMLAPPVSHLSTGLPWESFEITGTLEKLLKRLSKLHRHSLKMFFEAFLKASELLGLVDIAGLTKTTPSSKPVVVSADQMPQFISLPPPNPPQEYAASAGAPTSKDTEEQLRRAKLRAAAFFSQYIPATVGLTEGYKPTNDEERILSDLLLNRKDLQNYTEVADRLSQEGLRPELALSIALNLQHMFSPKTAAVFWAADNFREDRFDPESIAKTLELFRKAGITVEEAVAYLAVPTDRLAAEFAQSGFRVNTVDKEPLLEQMLCDIMAALGMAGNTGKLPEMIFIFAGKKPRAFRELLIELRSHLKDVLVIIVVDDDCFPSSPNSNDGKLTEQDFNTLFISSAFLRWPSNFNSLGLDALREALRAAAHKPAAHPAVHVSLPNAARPPIAGTDTGGRAPIEIPQFVVDALGPPSQPITPAQPENEEQILRTLLQSIGGPQASWELVATSFMAFVASMPRPPHPQVALDIADKYGLIRKHYKDGKLISIECPIKPDQLPQILQRARHAGNGGPR